MWKFIVMKTILEEGENVSYFYNSKSTFPWQEDLFAAEGFADYKDCQNLIEYPPDNQNFQKDALYAIEKLFKPAI